MIVWCIIPRMIVSALIDVFFPALRVAPRLHRADLVGPGPDLPKGGQVETHQHSGPLQRE